MRAGASPDPADRRDGSLTVEDVVRTHGRFLYAVAYRLTGNPDDAADLVQEALMRVQRGLAGFRPGSLEAWLSRIVTNVFLDERRRRSRRPVDFVAELPDRVTPTSAPPDAVIAAARLPEDLQDALSELPEEFRAVVVLSDVVGLRYGEIAEALDVPVGTVRSRLHRGRRMLRERLTGVLPTGSRA